MSSPPRFFSVDDARRHHFLDVCFLCKKPIAKNEDIFMYRGDTPFCSKECRWEQMDMDEALEHDRVVYSKQSSFLAAALRRRPSLIIPSNCDDKNQFRADTTIVLAGS